MAILGSNPPARPTPEASAEREMARCPPCGGSGLVTPRALTYRCESCQGRGVVPAERLIWMLVGVDLALAAAIDAGAPADVLEGIRVVERDMRACLRDLS
jgi:hypothetical protein